MLAQASACALVPHNIAYDRQQVSVPSQAPSFAAAKRHPVRLAPCCCRRPIHRPVIAMSFLREALKGAKADIDSAGNELLPRLGRAARVARILGVELAAIAALAPYGAYAMSVYRRLTALPTQLLPPPTAAAPAAATTTTTVASRESAQQQPQQQKQQQATVLAAAALHQLPLGPYGVAVHRQVSYGPASRNTLDVYVPLQCFRSTPNPYPHARQQIPQNRHQNHLRDIQQRQQQQEEGQVQGQGPQPPTTAPPLPVVFFVHGGVWASGETWQYAPMATRLAQAGLVVVVPTYTLYPEALAGTMVEEVSAALTWTLDNAVRYGGDPARVTAVGHSAGGHLISWALLRRAAAAEAAAATAVTTTRKPSQGVATTVAAPSPAAAGVPSPAVVRKNKPEGVGSGLRASYGQYVRQDEQQEDEQQPQGSAAHAGDRRDTAAYLLGGGGTSLPGAIHALRAVVEVQLHPQPGVDMSYDVDGGGRVAAAAAAAAAPTHVEADTRMPALFVGMSAVYDIAKHYEFEKSRAVHELSMMKRAVGGPAGFTAASPSVILARAAAAATAVTPPRPPPLPYGGSGDDIHFTSYFSSFELLGDAIPARSGLNGLGGDGGGSGSKTSATTVAEQGPAFSLAAAGWLPPFVVMGSCADHMVPWHEGAELVLQLRRCGVLVRHLLYNHVGHGDFVMAWRPLKTAAVMATAADTGLSAVDLGTCLEGLLPCARDLLRIVTGRTQLAAAAAPPPPPPASSAMSSLSSMIGIPAGLPTTPGMTTNKDVEEEENEVQGVGGLTQALAARSRL